VLQGFEQQAEVIPSLALEPCGDPTVRVPSLSFGDLPVGYITNEIVGDANRLPGSHPQPPIG
jgi:hypothetical protein